jgi:hypothetical protein
MTEQQIKDTLAFLEEKHTKELSASQGTLERAMLIREYDKNVELVKAGNNIFESKDKGDSDYECIGCGS